MPAASKKHMIVERGDVIYIIGPRPKHSWFEHEGMWEVCRIDNAVNWDTPEDEAVDRENARKICAALNAA